MSLPITDPCAAFRLEVFDKWPGLTDLGYYNRRPIAGSTTWSQHAWGNAQDLGGSTQMLDLVNAWLQSNRTRLKIRVLLWRVANHHDHIHVDFNPKKLGVPPYPSEDLVDDVVKGIQRSLNGSGFTDPSGQPLKVDGAWGPKTEWAYARMCVAAGESGVFPSSLTITAGHLEVQNG